MLEKIAVGKVVAAKCAKKKKKIPFEKIGVGSVCIKKKKWLLKQAVVEKKKYIIVKKSSCWEK